MSVSLQNIEELEKRLAVLQAHEERRDRLDALRARKRETRCKIIVGAALLAEIREKRHKELLNLLVTILETRVDRVRDRRDLHDYLGLSVKESELQEMGQETPNFDEMAADMLGDDGDEDDEIDAEYADVRHL